MEKPPINQQSNWPVLEWAWAEFANGSGLPPTVFTAIADRLRGAIESPDAELVQAAAHTLEAFYRNMVTASPSSVRDAARGEVTGETAASYALGKLAFAQLLAARIADTRADARFLEQVRAPKHLAYIRALGEGPLNVTQLTDKVGECIETVSRKLGVLRNLGIVVSRKQGTTVVNMLTPATKQLLDTLPPPTDDMQITRTVTISAARKALQYNRAKLPDYLKQAPTFSDKVMSAQFANRAA